MKKVDARNGNIVPGAAFTLTNEVETVTRTGVTDEQGAASLPGAACRKLYPDGNKDTGRLF